MAVSASALGVNLDPYETVTVTMDHLADLDLPAFTQAMSGIAAPEMGPPVRRTPNLASPTNGRQREKTTGPQGAGEPGVPVTIEP